MLLFRILFGSKKHSTYETLLVDRNKLQAFLEGEHDAHYINQANIALAEVERRILNGERAILALKDALAKEAEGKLCLEIFALREKYLPAKETA